MAECNKRLRREYQLITKAPPPHIIAKPNMSNLLEWHYVIFGPDDGPYRNGVYHGLLKFPPQFPHKPPSILMITPNGRFKTDTRICLSMSDFHPELWNPMWSISSILTGLLSFMLENKPTTGSMDSSYSEKQTLANYSMTFNKSNPAFIKIFPELLENDQLEQIRAKSTSTEPKETTKREATPQEDTPAVAAPPTIKTENQQNPPAIQAKNQPPNYAAWGVGFLLLIGFLNYFIL